MAASQGSGRDAEFVEFMAAAQPGLLRMARFLTGSDDQARELTQDALVRAYTAWPRVRGEGAVAYTRRIMINRRVTGWRRSSREEPHDPSDVGLEGTVADGGGTERRDEVVRLLATLPERQRKVVVLRYYVDLSEQQVADMMGISVGTVKSSASRGLASLRQHSILTGGTES
jgi:RNA polymerase sigma-70 factor (sigma-E family)